MSLDPRKPINNSKPITPAAPVRSKSSPYIAPRLANASGSTPSPELRRNGQVAGNGILSKGGNSSNITPPLKTILTTNITPRSSSRTSRAGSASSTPKSTPNITPVSSRPVSFTASFENPQGWKDANEADVTIVGKAESILSNGTSSARNARSTETNDGNNASPMFFHASDAASVPKKPSISSRSGTSFIYADGRQEGTGVKRTIAAGNTQGAQTGTQPKFYYANGRPEATLSKNASAGNVSSTTSPVLPTPIIPPRFDQRRQRSTSPLKEFEVPGESVPIARRTSGASTLSTKSATKSTIAAPSTTPISSAKHTNNRTHIKTQSMSLLETCVRPKTATNQPDSLLSSIHSIQNSHDTPLSTPTSPLTSPSPAGISIGEQKIDQLNAMASNARRERKVLDLEISNSSLLAINRTLEREMRKQKAELRRYRRLTSGGRLSIVPNHRSVSGATTISTVSTLSIDSDISSASDQDTILTDMQSDDEESVASDDSSLELFPEAQAARGLRQRQRDEKKLQVDLSRHRQILIDSQKLNESLKRCLGWTDELILQGKKALEYQVRAGEIAMGGRVLHEDDNPEMQDAPPRLGLLSPTDIDLKDADEYFSTDALPSSGAIDHE